MSMSRKDYEKTAAIVRAVRAGVASTPPVSDEDARFCRGVLCGSKGVAVGLANVFAGDNEHFDFDRFIAACGIEDTTTITGMERDQ
jgi:hypothetical protein